MRSGGWAAVRSDFAHYCRIHGADTPLRKLLLPLTANSLLALAVYRYGSWLHCGGSRALPHRVLYRVLSEVVRRLTRVLIPVWAELDERVWLASGAPLIVAGHVGREAALHAGVTLGRRVGGPEKAGGVPVIGPRAVIGPGASITGPVCIPGGAVIGPNTVVMRTPPPGAAWLGIPPVPWKGPPSALFPAIGASS